MSTNTNTEKVCGGRVAVDGENGNANGGANGSGGSVARAGDGEGKGKATPSPAQIKINWKRSDRLFHIKDRREDLAKIVEHLHRADQLLDGFLDAESRLDLDLVEREITNELMDAITYITRAQRLICL